MPEGKMAKKLVPLVYQAGEPELLQRSSGEDATMASGTSGVLEEGRKAQHCVTKREISTSD
jgi:hypothetical protein